MLKYAKKTQKNIDKYHWFDGRIVDVKSVPKNELEWICKKDNYIDTENTFVSSRGMVVSSSFMGTFVSLNVFNEFKTDSIYDVNETDQWFTDSKKLENTNDYIGYIFTSGENFYLNSCKFIPRLGPNGRSGLKSPTPKIIMIEGLRSTSANDQSLWEAISDDIILNDQGYLEATDIDFGDAVDIPMVGFRLVIKEWYPGAEPDMFTGLYKLEFQLTPATKVKLKDMGITKKGYCACIDKIEEDKTIMGSIKIEDITGSELGSNDHKYATISFIDNIRSDITALQESVNSIISDSSNITNTIDKEALLEANVLFKDSEYIDYINSSISNIKENLTTTDVRLYQVEQDLNGTKAYYHDRFKDFNMHLYDTYISIISDRNYKDINIPLSVYKKFVIIPTLISDKVSIDITSSSDKFEMLIDNSKNIGILELSFRNTLYYEGNTYNKIVLEPDSLSVLLTKQSYDNYVLIEYLDN